MPLLHILAFSFLLFAIGAAGVLVRKNVLVIFMCIELMLNSVNLAFVGFSRQFGDSGSHVMVLMVFVVAAVEVGVGMAIVVNMYRRRRTLSVDEFTALQG
jgi:NADH-quinone oxidoreductase subunit K